ncbi:MAG: PE-PPE domain-containing protein [Actinomycetia bacterium]|nr:PE-PPE domain-containing protein [Actinomycetes bacterium]MCH9702607.1 PE-PPE domain-containing protein [Actinomycetes bacterium]MCH9761837.1 PE-PPE domain-containing protein [Actinomycetes bacterium]
MSPLAALAALLPLVAAPPAAAAPEPAPAKVLTISPLWPVVPVRSALGGSLCRSNICETVPYVPFWTANGVTSLNRKLTGTADDDPTPDGPTVVFAYSNGALAAARWIAQHSDVPQAPSPEELSFVLIGNPARGHGGTIPPIQPSEYHTLDIVRQYDPLADFPDDPFNLLAMANIAAGIVSPTHLDYTKVDIDDPANTTWTEGTTTYVFVPTPELPLLDPLRLVGMRWLADALNEPLTEIVERAYDRSYLPAAPTDQPVAAPPDQPAAAPAETASEPHVADPAEATAVGSNGARVSDGDDSTAAITGESETPGAASAESPGELVDEPDPRDPTDPTDLTDGDHDDEDADEDTLEGDSEQGPDAQAAPDELTPANSRPAPSADAQQPDAQQPDVQEAGDTGGE